jgi:hypothetical protein
MINMLYINDIIISQEWVGFFYKKYNLTFTSTKKVVL